MLFLLPNISNEDGVTTRLETLARLAYMSHDDEVIQPLVMLRRILAEARRRKSINIIGLHANSRHTVWKSVDINA